MALGYHARQSSSWSGVWVAALIAGSLLACNLSYDSNLGSANTKVFHVRVDDATIARGHAMEVIDPVWWTANIYDGPAAYDQSLKQFSKAQRLVHAMLWYREEVDNGGHEQFYSNSTGIVWRDALEGFEAAAMPEVAAIVRESANRLGGSPSLVREERQKQLKTMAPKFDDLDGKYYEYDKRADVEAKIMEYIRSRPKDFYFTGRVRKIVLAK